MIGQTNWDELEQLSGAELKGAVFDILQEAAVAIHERESDDPGVLSLVPRLASLIERKDELSSYAEPFGALARSVGLWNYIDKTNADPSDRIVAEAVTVDDLGGVTLHREQISALNTLLSGRNLILSAPTSFGKSILIDALLSTDRYRRIAIVLPTIALLDEFRRRLSERFGQKYSILMHHSEVPEHDGVIFLGTQERLINRDDLGTLDLVVVDEFYKLDPERRDDRSLTLNAAVYQLLRRTKQFFFLGPNIELVHLSEGSRWRFEFLRTRFATVAVDTYDLSKIENKEQRLHQEAYNEKNWPALVFVSSPDKANRLAANFINEEKPIGKASELADWIAGNYGRQWELVSAVRNGVAVHHGRLPRALASRFVRLFNDKKIPILVCTSTLIEGVNTAARSVLIYDKTIAREKYDFFTFSNIRGRAGRLGQHHVGRVFLFNEPPMQADVEVSAPLFGDFEAAPDELVVHIEPEDTTPSISSRVSDLAHKAGIDASELKRYSSLGVDNLVSLSAATQSALSAGQQLGWDQWPGFEQVEAVCQVICKVKKPQDFGCASARQLAWYLLQLRGSGTMKGFFDWYSGNFSSDIQRYDGVFRFLRACEFNLPEWFSAVEMFVGKAGRYANYNLFVGEMVRWFRAEPLKILEEQGVPIQIAERFIRHGDSVTNLSRRLRDAALQSSPLLTSMERRWVLDALPR